MDKTKHLENKYSLARFSIIKLCDADELRWYLYVKLYAINKSSAFPSFKSFTRDLGWSKYSVIRIIKKMERKKRLKVQRSMGRNNIYDITWYDKKNDMESSRETLTTSGRETSTTTSRETSTLTNKNKTIKKERSIFSPFKKKKPFFQGEEMRNAQGRWWVIQQGGGQWLEFAGKESEIEWR